MGIYNGANKIVITLVSKTFSFDLLNDADKNLEHEINFIMKHNKFLSEHTIKNKISRLLFKFKHGNDINEHEKE